MAEHGRKCCRRRHAEARRREGRKVVVRKLCVLCVFAPLREENGRNERGTIKRRHETGIENNLPAFQMVELSWEICTLYMENFKDL